MTFKGVYRDGVVHLDHVQGLRNGTVVDVVRSSRSAPKNKKVTAKAKTPARGTTRVVRKATKSGEKHPLPGFGAWKHRTDIADTAAFARSLRRRVSARPLAD